VIRDEKHLTVEEIDDLIETQLRASESGAQSELLRQARFHLASCEACQRLVSMHKGRDQVLRSLHETHVAARTVECPPNVALFELAAGLAHEMEADQLLTHVTQCSHCGPLFRLTVEVFRERLAPEEQPLLQSLQSAHAEWQVNLARQLTAANGEMKALPAASSKQTHPVSRVPGWTTILASPRLLWTGALATTLALAVWFGIPMTKLPDVNQLLATAYTEQRLMDLRVAGAKYAPMRQKRGAGQSTLDQPQALLDATPLISRHLKAHPDDPKWLQAKGRADLLAFRYEPALQTLQRAVDLQPDSPALLIDLATAYFQRAEKNTDRAVDYGVAIDYLGRALAHAPDDPVALFNRAVAEDKLHLYDPAIHDWEHYLQIDSTGPWADEARKRLAEVQKKAQNKQSSLRTPLLGTDQISSFVDSRELRAELNVRVEEYLHAAITEWLPQAFPRLLESQKSRQAQAALTSLAKVLQDRHSDSWLMDLLAHPEHLTFAPAISALATALRANDSGDYAKGRMSARSAAAYFRSAHNLAGELRSQAEEVYSDHLLYDGRKCMHIAGSVRQRLPERRYMWLEAEMSLESATCEGLIGDLGRARSDISLGTKLAHDHEYASLFLRGLGFQADTAGLLGDTQADFSLASQGLDVFWNTPVDIMKGYNLYTDLDTAADVLRFPHLQVVLWQQATALIDLHPDILQRAMAHRWLANSAYLANMPGLAAQEFGKAGALFAASPPSEATARGKMDADIWLAELQIRQGDLQTASATLRQVQDALARAPSFGPAIGFYSAKTELSLRGDDSTATESALRAAIYLAEWALRSFPSETARRQWARQTDQAYRNLVAWRLRQDDPVAALEFWEWYKGAEYRTKTLTFEPTLSLDLTVPPDPRDAPPLRTPSVVAQRLPVLREQTVITYAVFPAGTAVWVYDDRGIFSRWIATSPEDLQKQALLFERLCSRHDSDLSALRATARALYDLLITPIQSRLMPDRTLVFELDDVLSAVPMDALVDHEGRYLAQQTTVVVAPSVYQTLHLHAALPIGPQTAALVVSVPTSQDEDLPPLADAESEAQVVANSFHSTHWLKGSLATVAAIRHELGHSLVFHFSGHAVSSPEMTGLLLAERDAHTQRSRVLNAHTLDAEAVRNLQLAVLAACDTASGNDPRISGNDGVTQTLLRYGVPHVVASRWNVDSSQTAILMRWFYQRLTAGDSVPASLHFAQLALLSQPASAHPYYWAAFAVRGV
jgi:CHAT domain-containing protein/tetratricopeptide (TPR) repeat protein